MMVSRRPYKDQLGKVSCEAGIVRKSKMKKRMQAGEKGTRWQHSGRKSKKTTVGDDDECKAAVWQSP